MGIDVRRRIIAAPTLINRANWQEILSVTLSGSLRAVDNLAGVAGGIPRFVNSDSAQLVQLSDAVAGLLNAASVSAFVTSLGTIPASQLPAIAITDTFTVGSQAAMLALTAERGDIAVRSDLNKCYVLAADDPTVLANWTLLLTPTDAVLSVAGLTGAISAGGLKTALAIAVADITNASANGRSLISAANYAAMKTLLAIASTDVSGLGSLATASSITASLISDASANGRSLIAAANYAAMKTLLAIAAADVSGLGTAAALNVGTGANQVVQLTAASKLPAVDGSLLTNLPSAPVSSVAGLTGAISSGSLQTALDLVDKTNAQTVNGVKTFGSIPILPAADPTTSNQAARKSYVDDKFTAAVAAAAPIPSSSAYYPVGFSTFLFVGAGSVNNGSTIAGSSLYTLNIDSVTPAFTTSNGTQTGTWTNISGYALGAPSRVGQLVRTA